MPTYRFVVKAGVTGSSTRGLWANVFHIAIANTIDSADIQTAADGLIAALRKVTLDTVTFYSVTVKDPTQDGHGYDAAKVRSLPYNLVGQKVTAAGAGEPKEIIVRFRGKTTSGRPGHFSLRLAVLDSEVVAGGEGEPFAAGGAAGSADTAAALNALIAGGTEFHAYSKLKSGAVSDRAITEFEFQKVGARTARRHHKKKAVGTNPKTWLPEVLDWLKQGLQVAGGYTVAKTISAELATPALEAGVPALEAAVEELVPVLAALL